MIIMMQPVIMMMITMITMPGPARSITSNLMIHRVSNDDVDDTESLSYHQVNHRDDVTLTLPTPGESDHG